MRALVIALAVALWFAGTLGLMHRTLHVPGMPALSSSAAVAATDAAAAATPAVHQHAGHTLAGLFGHHTDAECRLYDQLSHGSSAPGVPLVVLPMLLPSATFAFLEGEAIARWVALFEARGPPSTR
jgi:hypothetical protein